jgi:hypothetical protein
MCQDDPPVPHDVEAADDKQRFMRLLNEALGLADALGLAPEIGARLQEVIDLAETSAAPERH